MDKINPNALAPGTVLRGASSYTIERVLGSGGFGITYLASVTIMHGNIRMKGQVAIKEHFINDYCDRQQGSTNIVVTGKETIRLLVENSRKDFLAEARRLHKLGTGHDNIVHVNEVFEANGTAYYVMEYLDGRSLQQYIEANGPLDSAAIRCLMAPIVDAAAYLHKNRFTHLDIKPANIMLAEGADGGVRPVLIDFGLSKHYDEHGNATSTVNTCGASDGYAPVEQYQGISTFSPAADVYALGATMLACATGRRPSPSANWLPGEPAATIAALPVDDGLKSAITRAMANAAHDRFPDAGALLAALGGNGGNGGNTYNVNIKKEPADSATRILTPSKSKRSALIGAITGLLVAIIGTCLIIYLRPASEPAPEEAVAELAADSIAPTEPEVLSHQWWEARRTPRNLYLAVNRSGGQYYLSEEDYRSLNPGQQSALPKAGVVVGGGGEQFILALNDLTSEKLNWNQAMRRYGNYLPTKAQAEAWMAQNAAIKEAVINFGGSWQSDPDMWYWTKTELNGNNLAVWHVYMQTSRVGTIGKTYLSRLRAVAPLGGSPGQTQNGAAVNSADYATPDKAPDATAGQAGPAAPSADSAMPDVWWNRRRTPQNLHLAVDRNGIYYYLSEADYNGLSSSQKSGLNKVGVVIIGNGERFILALSNLTTETMNWDEAMRRYGSQLPTKAQAEAWGAQKEAIQTAVSNFGGSEPNGWYWTKTEYESSIAWSVGMNTGNALQYFKSNTGKVRAVAPLR